MTLKLLLVISCFALAFCADDDDDVAVDLVEDSTEYIADIPAGFVFVPEDVKSNPSTTTFEIIRDDDGHIALEMMLDLTVVKFSLALFNEILPVDILEGFTTVLPLQLRDLKSNEESEINSGLVDALYLIKTNDDNTTPDTTPSLIFQIVVRSVQGMRLNSLRLCQVTFKLDQEGTEISRALEYFELQEPTSAPATTPAMEDLYSHLLVVIKNDQTFSSSTQIYSSSSTGVSYSFVVSLIPNPDSNPDYANIDSATVGGSVTPTSAPIFTHHHPFHCRSAYWFKHLTRTQRIVLAVGFVLISMLLAYVASRCCRHCLNQKNKALSLSKTKLHCDYETLPLFEKNDKKAMLLKGSSFVFV